MCIRDRYQRRVHGETEDGGKKWSEPVAVPRIDKNDVYNRDDLEAQFSWLNGRIWILYNKIDPKNPEVGELHMVSRAPGSKVFSNEISLHINPGFFRFFLNEQKGLPVLSVFFIKGSKGMIMESRNSGIHWKDPVQISACADGDSVSSFFTGGQGLPTYQYAVCTNSKGSHYIMWSSNFHESWNGPLQLNGNLMDDGCSAGESPSSAITMYLIRQEDKLVVGYTKAGSNEMTVTTPAQFPTLMQYCTCVYRNAPQFGLWTLSEEDGALLVRLTYNEDCLLYTSPSPRDLSTSRMPSSA
eukprot:TRINITY_DN3714_c0_g1_i5.p1 TRINITY_DN3714_c0_g1~~TRINITY_DN3714_c0_g1_i5.p1  ORF type:complete len:313 (-),score=51.65 TRINITY_DN3714_c0_g1_i5:110-1003(-)